MYAEKSQIFEQHIIGTWILHNHQLYVRHLEKKHRRV